MFYREVKSIIWREYKLEFRQKTSINSILHYVISTIFVVYLSYSETLVPQETWNTFFWIIFLFASVNAIAKSFLQESEEVQLYLYTLASPQAVFMAKAIYNFVLLLVLEVLAYLVFIILFDNPVVSYDVFALTLILTSAGFASALTMISAIVAQARGNASLMAILSFPVVLPLLLLALDLMNKAMQGMSITDTWQSLLVLLLANMIINSLGFLLFPYIWRD